MWGFSKKYSGEVYEKVLEKLKFLESEISSLRAKTEAIETNVTSLRNSVNRKKSLPDEDSDEALLRDWERQVKAEQLNNQHS